MSTAPAQRHLKDQERRAVQLARDLRKAMRQWLRRRDGEQGFTVSPFIDPTGQPAVMIRVNAHVACAMMDSLNQQDTGASE